MGNRLRDLGIGNKHAVIKGLPVLSDTQGEAVAKQLMIMSNLPKTHKNVKAREEEGL